jgi:DNA-binding transcriptional ArsR family regulator
MRFEDTLTALADPTRREILAQLREGPRSVREIADTLPVSRPAVSQHLRTLREAGLADVEARGTRRLYSLRPEGLLALRSWLENFWDAALEDLQRAAQDGEDPR